MPGIAGIIGKLGAPVCERQHSEMLRAMNYEPFYTGGTYSEQTLSLSVGWVLPEKSFCSAMPLINRARDLVMIFYGEDFSRHSSSVNPRRSGACTGFGNADYLLRLYEDRGESFVRDLNGWFAGVLIDLNQQKFLLFNDRYGMQRLYYHESDKALFFSSEAKSLLRVLPSVREINPEALAEYVAFDCVLENKSLFKDVLVLPGGSCWSFQNGQCRKKRYFNPESLNSTAPLDESEALDRLEEVFVDLLPAYLHPYDQIAISLTGGLDTRLIVAAAPEVNGLPAYTFAGDRDTFDVRQSRRVAEASGMDYQVVRLGEDFFQDFPRLAEETVYISDGQLGVNGTHNLYLNRLARKIAPVRLTGLFGSEVLRQGRILPRAPQVSRVLSPDLCRHIEDAEQRVIAHRSGHRLTAALSADIPWRTYGLMSVERSQVTLRSPFIDNQLVELLYALPNSIRESKRVQQKLIRRLNPELSRIFSNRGHASGRNPVLATVVQAFLFLLFKLDYLYLFEPPTWSLKFDRAVRSIGVRQWLIGYHKFEHYRLWAKERWGRYLSDVLLDSRTLQRSFLDKDLLNQTVTEHASGKRESHSDLSMALTLELVTRTLIEGNATAGMINSLAEPQLHLVRG